MGLAYLKRQRGKKSITLDLKSKAGIEVFLELVRTADVVVDNFSSGVMARLGIYASLAEINPSIVCCSLTGYGQTGRPTPRFSTIDGAGRHAHSCWSARPRCSPRKGHGDAGCTRARPLLLVLYRDGRFLKIYVKIYVIALTTPPGEIADSASFH